MCSLSESSSRSGFRSNSQFALNQQTQKNYLQYEETDTSRPPRQKAGGQRRPKPNRASDRAVFDNQRQRRRGGSKHDRADPSERQSFFAVSTPRGAGPKSNHRDQIDAEHEKTEVQFPCSNRPKYGQHQCDIGRQREDVAASKNYREYAQAATPPALQREALANHLLALAPQCVRARRVESVGAYSSPRNRVVIHLAHVTVFTVAPTYRVGRCDEAAPYRGRRSLRHVLEPQRRFSTATAPSRLHLLDELGGEMTAELSLDSTRMQ